MSWALRSVLPVWGVAVVGVVLVVVLAGADYLTWLPVAMAACVLTAFGIQLPIGRREGLVGRLSAGVGGALVILVIATAVLVIAVPEGSRLVALPTLDRPAAAGSRA